MSYIERKISEELKNWNDVGWLMEELENVAGWNFNDVSENDISMKDLETIILERLTADEQEEILDFLMDWG